MVPLELSDAVTVLCIIAIHFDCSDGNCLIFTPHESVQADANTIFEMHRFSYLCIVCYGKLAW